MQKVKFRKERNENLQKFTLKQVLGIMLREKVMSHLQVSKILAAYEKHLRTKTAFVWSCS